MRVIKFFIMRKGLKSSHYLCVVDARVALGHSFSKVPFFNEKSSRL